MKANIMTAVGLVFVLGLSVTLTSVQVHRDAVNETVSAAFNCVSEGYYAQISQTFKSSGMSLDDSVTTFIGSGHSDIDYKQIFKYWDSFTENQDPDLVKTEVTHSCLEKLKYEY